MELEKFCKDHLHQGLYTSLVNKLLPELIQCQNGEEPYSLWYEEEGNEDEPEYKELYYILTNKRFFKICVDSGSFNCKSYFLKHLNSFRETVVPYRKEPDAFERSVYFSEGDSGVKSYTVEFSFSGAEGESNTKTFTLSALESWKNSHFRELREFVKGFHKVVTNL